MKTIPVVSNSIADLGGGWFVASGSLVVVDADGRHWVDAWRRDEPGTQRVELVRGPGDAYTITLETL